MSKQRSHILYTAKKAKCTSETEKLEEGERERIIVGEVMLIRTKIGSPWSP